MEIGDHVNEMRFELADRPDTKVDSYLPMSWLKDNNPDINWERGSLRWCSNYCKAHCRMARRRLHQREFDVAPGAPGASDASGAPGANRCSGCVVAYSFRRDANPTCPGAPDAPGRQPTSILHLVSALDFC